MNADQSPLPKILFIGLDVHAASCDVALAMAGSREVTYHGRIDGTLAAVDRLLKRLAPAPSAVCVVYEAGPTGFVLARHLRSRGVRCEVAAPALIPRKSGERVKTNRLDAQRLARLARSGELTFVHVPDASDEAIRDLVRARTSAVEDLRRARQRLQGLLLRQGRRGELRGRAWTRAYRESLVRLSWPHEAHRVVCHELLQALDTEQGRIERLDAALEALLPSWRWANVVQALRCLRGFDTLSAMTLVAEVGDFSRFASPEQLSAFFGLVPGEASTGTRRIQGAITKTGNSACRRTLVESAHHYRRAPAVGTLLRRRQHGQPEALIQQAWQAQIRLCARFEHLSRQHKKRTVVVTAVARELAGFVWAQALRAMGRSLPPPRRAPGNGSARLVGTLAGPEAPAVRHYVLDPQLAPQPRPAGQGPRPPRTPPSQRGARPQTPRPLASR